MPWVVRKSKQCPTSKPWGVFNKTTGRKVACHATEKEARKQQEALYVHAPD